MDRREPFGRNHLKNDLIRNHLRNMIILGIPMHAMCGGMFFPGCRLRTLDDGSFGIAGPSLIKEDVDVSLTYTNDGYVYGFETKPAARDCDPSAEEPLPLHLPERIVRIERRKSYRATCPEDEPVTVLVNFGGREARAEAVVISEESIGLSLPPETSALAVDSIVTITVCLPRLGDVAATGTVRFIRDSSGNRGLVVRFDEMPDDDRELICRYVRTRQIVEKAGDRAEGRESGFLVARHADGHKHAFWCPPRLLGSIDVLDEALEVVSVDALRYL
jgi:c-di-GMP-binding flagellar brake protein YcgR